MVCSIEDILERVKQLTTKPEVVVKTEQMLLDPEVSFKSIAGVISRDPGLTARVFKVANSCFFGRMSKAKTLTEAIITIGIKGLYSLILIHIIKEYYKSFGQQEMYYWNHAVSVSITAMVLATETELIDTENAMVGGLLHDIGKDLLHSAEPSTYAIVNKRVYTNGVTSSAAEQALFGFTHSEVGYELAKRWYFPDDIQTVILYHHDIATAKKESRQSHLLTCLVNLSDIFCNRIEMGAKNLQNGFRWRDIEAAKILELSEEHLQDLEPKIIIRIEEEKSMFD